MKRRRRERLRRFPVTTLLLLQHVPLVLLPAFRFGTPGRGQVLGILAAAIGTTFAVEANVKRLHLKVRPRTRTPKVAARTILAGGIFATVAAAGLGVATYATQIGAGGRSAFAVLFTPLQVWTVIGLALVVYQIAEGVISRRTGFRIIAVAMIVQVAIGVYIGRLAPAMSAGLTVAFMLWVIGTIRLRWIVVALIAVSLAWPTLYNVRNAQRVAAGGEAVELGLHDPGDRLRLDLNFALVSELRSRPPSPSPLRLLRFGVVPRVIDSGRGELLGARDLNVALGGTSTSSASLTLFGNVYAFLGMYGVIAYSAAVALLVAVVGRKQGPWWTASLALIVTHLIWIEATFPDSIPGLLQSGQALIAAAVVSRAALAFYRAFRELGTRQATTPHAAAAAATAQARRAAAANS